MLLYWPCGKRKTAYGDTEPISTYGATVSLADARQQIELWKDWYKFDIVESWIDVYNRGEKVNTIYVEL